MYYRLIEYHTFWLCLIVFLRFCLIISLCLYFLQTESQVLQTWLHSNIFSKNTHRWWWLLPILSPRKAPSLGCHEGFNEAKFDHLVKVVTPNLANIKNKYFPVQLVNKPWAVFWSFLNHDKSILLIRYWLEAAV